MTTVAYRDGIIAADTGVEVSGTFMGHVSKIARNEMGDLAGVSGLAARGFTFLKWFKDGETGSRPTPIEREEHLDRWLIVRAATGRITIIEPMGEFEMSADYYAMGSGRDVAIGAMAAGATADRAVEYAIRHDNGTSGNVEALSKVGD